MVMESKVSLTYRKSAPLGNGSMASSMSFVLWSIHWYVPVILAIIMITFHILIILISPIFNTHIATWGTLVREFPPDKSARLSKL
jgi:hypothetical protein